MQPLLVRQPLRPLIFHVVRPFYLPPGEHHSDGMQVIHSMDVAGDGDWHPSSTRYPLSSRAAMLYSRTWALQPSGHHGTVVLLLLQVDWDGSLVAAFFVRAAGL